MLSRKIDARCSLSVPQSPAHSLSFRTARARIHVIKIHCRNAFMHGLRFWGDDEWGAHEIMFFVVYLFVFVRNLYFCLGAQQREKKWFKVKINWEIAKAISCRQQTIPIDGECAEHILLFSFPLFEKVVSSILCVDQFIVGVCAVCVCVRLRHRQNANRTIFVVLKHNAHYSSFSLRTRAFRYLSIEFNFPLSLSIAALMKCRRDARSFAIHCPSHYRH